MVNNIECWLGSFVIFQGMLVLTRMLNSFMLNVSGLFLEFMILHRKSASKYMY